MRSVLSILLAVSSFLYADVVWQAPSIVSDPLNPNASQPAIGTDVAGNGIAVWVQSSGPNSSIQAATKKFGNAWDITLDTLSTSAANNGPQVAVDVAGNAIAVWENTTAQTIEASTKYFEGPWSAPVTISTLGQAAQKPQVAIDASGNAIAVWQEGSFLSNGIKAATKIFGTNWLPPVTISGGETENALPNIAIDPAGNARVVWINTLTNLLTVDKPVGGSWSMPFNLGQVGLGRAPFLQVVFDPSGNAVIVWLGANVQAITKRYGEPWSDVATLSLTPGREVDSVQVAVDPAGNAMAVWSNQTIMLTIFNIQAAYLPFGDVWSTPSVISAGPESAKTPQVKLGPTGNALALWAFNSPGPIQAASKNFGEDWAIPVTVDSTSGVTPAMAIDPAGNVLAVWVSGGVIQSSVGLSQ